MKSMTWEIGWFQHGLLGDHGLQSDVLSHNGSKFCTWLEILPQIIRIRASDSENGIPSVRSKNLIEAF